MVIKIFIAAKIAVFAIITLIIDWPALNSYFLSFGSPFKSLRTLLLWNNQGLK
jgi:hypothetical protein